MREYATTTFAGMVPGDIHATETNFSSQAATRRRNTPTAYGPRCSGVMYIPNHVRNPRAEGADEVALYTDHATHYLANPL